VLGEPDRHDLDRLARGVTIDGRSTAPADVIRLGPSRLRVTIREGRNRQVRKMCDAIGHPVTQLRRIAIGPLSDARLRVGQWRDLTAAEVGKLRGAAGRMADRDDGDRDTHRTSESRRERPGVASPPPERRPTRNRKVRP